MAAKARQMTQERLKSLLRYDPETGVFVWLVKPSKRRALGSIAGGIDRGLGYVVIRIGGISFLAHRLAWLYMTGEWPHGIVDHQDTVRSNNRWTNLRDVTNAVNMQNQRRATAGSRSGLLGAIALPNGRFQAMIKINGKSRHISMHDTAAAAHQAYVTMKRQVHEGNTL